MKNAQKKEKKQKKLGSEQSFSKALYQLITDKINVPLSHYSYFSVAKKKRKTMNVDSFTPVCEDAWSMLQRRQDNNEL